MIVGTAGHIDHGKTALVRALTGVDTDRLKEEKARGISIELGYAYLPVSHETEGSPDEVIGFVDVPGHERFVHTMVAGAAGIDFALLVVAADDGVMPQTREHLTILELLHVRHGAIALTKVDRVEQQRIAQVREELEALLARSVLAGAPVFESNSTQAGDPGVAALLAHLRAAARLHARPRDAEALFRMPVDRVFVLPGHGTTVTGPAYGGRAEPGSHVVLASTGAPLRIRGLHAQRRAAARGEAGQRCALNLAGIDATAIARGDWIADERAFVPSRHVDVRLRLLTSDTMLRDWTPLHVHWGTMHRTAHAVLLDDTPGRERLVQLVFEHPVCATTGDRFIVRNASATATIGGGVVLDPEAPHRRRRSPVRLAWLGAVERLTQGEGIEVLLQHAPMGVAMATIVRRCQRPPELIALPAGVRHVEGRDGGHLLLEPQWAALAKQVVDALGQWHQRRPDDPGVEGGRLQRACLPELPDDAWRALLQSLRDQGRIRQRGAWWLLPEHDRQLSDRERAALQPLLPLLHQGGFDPPWVRALATQLGLNEDQVRAVLRRAAARGEAYQVVPDLFYHPHRINELAGIVATLAQQHGGADAARFRDAIGLGRKRSIQILEFFDRVGYTRRTGDAHRPRGTISWGSDAAHDQA